MDNDKYVNIRTAVFNEYSEIRGVVPDLVKVDTEGAEYKILRGMQKTIGTYHPSLMIEAHPRPLRKAGISLPLLFQFLENAGYEIYLVNEYSVEAVSKDDLINLCITGRKNMGPL